MTLDTKKIAERVRCVLRRRANDLLRSHSCQIELLSVTDMRVRIRFVGCCSRCLSADESLLEQIQETLRAELGLPALEVVVCSGVSQDLIEQAKYILGRPRSQ